MARNLNGISEKEKIRVGDTIQYRPAWGTDPSKRVKVVSLEVTKESREKYGSRVSVVTYSEVADNRVCFDLDDGHWCYSSQVDGRVDYEGTGESRVAQVNHRHVREPIQSAYIKKDLGDFLVRLKKADAEHIVATLEEWYEQVGPIEDLDNNKTGLTKERYKDIIQKLKGEISAFGTEL